MGHNTEENTEYDTEGRSNRWEDFMKMTFPYLIDDDYELTQDFSVNRYVLEFEHEENDYTAQFVYNGTPQHMAEESMQHFENLFENSMELWQQWARTWERE